MWWFFLQLPWYVSPSIKTKKVPGNAKHLFNPLSSPLLRGGLGGAITQLLLQKVPELLLLYAGLRLPRIRQQILAPGQK